MSHEFYFLIFEKSDRRFPFVPLFVEGEGEAQLTIEIVSMSLPKAVNHCSIVFLNIKSLPNIKNINKCMKHKQNQKNHDKSCKNFKNIQMYIIYSMCNGRQFNT